MKINKDKCVGCGICVKYCPVKAISIADKKASIDLDICVECGSCKRIECCEFDAIQQQKLEWPRVMRSILSDVTTVYKGVAGRGTEEMKTNDVTGRLKNGFSGVAVEMGRPSVSAKFKDIEFMTKIAARYGAVFEECNPISSLITDYKTGEINPEVLNERVLSGIIELIVPNEKLEELIKAFIDGSKHIDTVFSLGVACKVEDEGRIPSKELLDKAGIHINPSFKVNVGLGKPQYIF
jgi:ferredoxin